MKMKSWIAGGLFSVGVFAGIGIIGNAAAYDNGAQVIGCDYSIAGRTGTDRCLILGSGMGQGSSWTVFELRKVRYRYESGAPRQMTILNASNQPIRNLPVRNMQGQCRPGGADADIYAFQNGDKICLYW